MTVTPPSPTDPNLVRRAGRLSLAALLVVSGAAMLVLPGPGVIALAMGLGIAGRELRWEQAARAEAELLALAARLRFPRRAVRAPRPSTEPR